MHFHDIGSFEDKRNHAIASAEIASKWLEEDAGYYFAHDEIEHIVKMIADHSEKENRTDDLLSNILKDADLLDEIGAMSVIMGIEKLDKNSDLFFESVIEKLEDKEIKYCDEVNENLVSKGAKMILQRKRKLILEFTNNLKSEIMYDSEF